MKYEGVELKISVQFLGRKRRGINSSVENFLRKNLNIFCFFEKFFYRAFGYYRV